jgi:mRNA interferase RelE/StbE
MVSIVFKLRYHPDVRTVDIPQINSRLKDRIKNAIEARLLVAPHQYGEPLRKTLKGYWKLRVGDYRVVYKIAGDEVWILGIIHRRDVYEKILNRV